MPLHRKIPLEITPQPSPLAVPASDCPRGVAFFSCSPGFVKGLSILCMGGVLNDWIWTLALNSSLKSPECWLWHYSRDEKLPCGFGHCVPKITKMSLPTPSPFPCLYRQSRKASDTFWDAVSASLGPGVLSGLHKGIDLMLTSTQASSSPSGLSVCVHAGGGRGLSKSVQNFLSQIFCCKLKAFSLISFLILSIMPKWDISVGYAQFFSQDIVS